MPPLRGWTAVPSALVVVTLLGACGRAPEAMDVERRGSADVAETIEAPPRPDEAMQAEPVTGEAVAVIERYYAAIDAGDYAHAYRLWSDGGRASGQSAASFAAGFEDTTSVSVDTGAPGRVGAAAGSRYIEVPVVIRAVHADRSEHRFEGSYTLRRAVVDGASPEQRQWRIASARLREVKARTGS